MNRVAVVGQHILTAEPTASSKPLRYDIIIRNGTVFDGLRTPRFVSDVGIRDGRIATIGRIAAGTACNREIDATGLNVAPGFVDLHTHYDSQIFWDPYCTLSGWHGVTSVVIGNCGFGFAPCKPEDRVRAMKSMERNEAVPYEAMAQGMPWDWVSFPEFLDSVEKTPKGVNVLSYVGLCPVMGYVMGLENAKSRRATEEEMAQMLAIMREAMDSGACGFSVQMFGEASVQRDYDGTPMITDLMHKDDLLAFATELGKIGRGFIQCTGPTPKLTEKLAEASGRPVVYNIVAAGVDQHGTPIEDYKRLLTWLEAANARGNRIFGQALTVDVGFTFTFEHWNLFDSSVLWRNTTLGTPEERIAKMKDPKNRRLLVDEYDSGKAPIAGGGTEDAAQAGGEGLSELVFERAEKGSMRKWEGMRLKEIAQQQGKHVIETLLDLAVEDELKSEWKTPTRHVDVEAVKEIARSPYTIPGLSDGGAHTKFSTIGGYPTEFLAKLCRDNDCMDLEEAHWRLAKYPAQAAGLLDRGHLAEGMPADVVVYDYKNLEKCEEEKVYDFPGGEWRRIRRAKGYKFTIVNGEITFEGQECTGATPGHLLRHGSSVTALPHQKHQVQVAAA